MRENKYILRVDPGYDSNTQPVTYIVKASSIDDAWDIFWNGIVPSLKRWSSIYHIFVSGWDEDNPPLTRDDFCSNFHAPPRARKHLSSIRYRELSAKGNTSILIIKIPVMKYPFTQVEGL